MATSTTAAKSSRSRKKAPPRFHLSELASDQHWREWSKRLPPQEPLALLPNVWPGESISPLLWSLPNDLADGPTATFIKSVSFTDSPSASQAKKLSRLLSDWLDDSGRQGLMKGHSGLALEAIACVGALQVLHDDQFAELWRALADRLLELTSEATAIDGKAHPLTWQLMAGELPLALAWCFDEIIEFHDLCEMAGETISAGLDRLLDGEGLVHARSLPLMRPLMATWTRCGLMARSMRFCDLHPDAMPQLEWMVRQAMRLARHDGSQILSTGAEGAWSQQLFDAALDLDEDLDDVKMATWALPRRGKRTKDALPDASEQSEWSELALLRTDFSRKSPRLAVAYADKRIEAELAGRVTIARGCWDPQIHVDGKALSPATGWEQTCWYADDSVVYLELEAQFTHGWKVQRHFALARKDDFLFVADAVIGKSAAELDYRLELPLVEGVEFEPQRETREGLVASEKKLAQILPLALPEWRSDLRFGELKASDEGVALHQASHGQGLFAPLFLDLSRPRFKKELTWRRLAVAENLQNLPADQAVGYRVQIGADQWLIYRSLAPAANRSVLGQNRSSEFFIAKFKRSGEVKIIVEVEPEG